MATILGILSIVAASMFKFAFSPLVAYQMGYSFWQTLLITSVSGCISVTFFYRTSAWFMERSRLRKLHRSIADEHRGITTRKKVFTRTNRFIIRIKHGPGLFGLVALTPVIISLPIGAILAAKFFPHDRRTLPALLLAVLIWAVVLSIFWSVTK